MLDADACLLLNERGGGWQPLVKETKTAFLIEPRLATMAHERANNPYLQKSFLRN